MKINMALGLIALTLLTADPMTTNAQESKMFSLEDLNFGGHNYRNMVPKTRWTTWWGNQLVHQDIEKCSIIDKKTGKEKTLFSLEEVNKWLEGDADGGLKALYNVTFPYPNEPIAMIENHTSRIFLNFKTHKIVAKQGTAGMEDADWHAASKNTAFRKNDNLFVRDSNGKDFQITQDGSRNIMYGTSVHRDEFGYSKGTFWSPDGSKLMFTRMDQSMVNDYPLVNIPELDWKPGSNESRSANAAPEKYPMVGETSHKVTIGVYDLKTERTVYLQAGDPTNRYFTNPSWAPDGKTVYLFELNRDQNDCHLVAYNPSTGEKIKELYHETDAKFVEPQHPIAFLPWDSSSFVFQSQRDGYYHLYLYSLRSGSYKQLTSGSWVVLDMLGFNTKTRSVVYLSNECSPVQQNTWAVSTATGKRTLLDNGRGWHTPTLSGDGSYMVDTYQEPDVPRVITINATDKKQYSTYFTADDPYKGYTVPEYTMGTVKADDGTTDLYWRMVKPINFDPKKKYPAIVYVYGGPHAHNVDARWHYGSRTWETYMAQNGYLMFILDNRGSEHRGKEFEQATFRHLGDVEVRDQMQGVKYLQSLSYVDTTRIGVHGWSFGGFMTTTLMTTHPEVFKVGVAGGPVIDWKWYEVMYGERYMDTPQANPEGYAQSSLLPKAKDLKGKLQIIIGLNDPVVVPQHAYSFLKACIAAGTQPDFFVYPGEPHNMRGHQSTHLHERISQYFFDYMPSDAIVNKK